MFTITHNFAPAQPLLRREAVEKPLTEKKKQTDRTVQAETRLWKLTAEAVQPKMVRGELLVLLAVVVSATGLSVRELSRLMRSNAIEHVTARALQGSE